MTTEATTITRQQFDTVKRYDLEYTGHGYSEHRDMVEITTMEGYPESGGDWVRWEDVVALFEASTAADNTGQLLVAAAVAMAAFEETGKGAVSADAKGWYYRGVRAMSRALRNNVSCIGKKP